MYNNKKIKPLSIHDAKTYNLDDDDFKWFEIEKNHFVLSQILEENPKIECVDLSDVCKKLDMYWEVHIRKYESYPRPYTAKITLYPSEEKQTTNIKNEILSILARFADLDDAFLWVEEEIEAQETCLEIFNKETIQYQILE